MEQNPKEPESDIIGNGLSLAEAEDFQKILKDKGEKLAQEYRVKLYTAKYEAGLIKPDDIPKDVLIPPTPIGQPSAQGEEFDVGDELLGGGHTMLPNTTKGKGWLGSINLMSVVVSIVLAVFVSLLISSYQFVSIKDDKVNISGIVTDMGKLKTDIESQKTLHNTLNGYVVQLNLRLLDSDKRVTDLSKQIIELKNQIEQLKLQQK